MYIWGTGRASGRVGSDFLSAMVGRVGSTFRRVGSGRFQEKWPVDKFALPPTKHCIAFNCKGLRLSIKILQPICIQKA